MTRSDLHFFGRILKQLMVRWILPDQIGGPGKVHRRDNEDVVVISETEQRGLDWKIIR